MVIDSTIFIDIFVNQNQNNKLNRQYLLNLLNKKAKQNFYVNAQITDPIPLIENKLSSAKSSTSDTSIKNKKISMDDIKFLREMTFLKTWPIDMFTEEPSSVKSCVFNREQLITADSNSSKFIYIVKSGSISVLISLNQNNSDSNDKTEQSNEQDAKKNLNEGGYFPMNALLDDHHKEVLLQEGMLKKRTDEEIKKDIEAKMRLNEVMTYLASMKKLDAESTRDVNTNSRDKNDAINHDKDDTTNVSHLIHMDDDDASSLSEYDIDDRTDRKQITWIDFAIKKVHESNKQTILKQQVLNFKSKLQKNKPLQKKVNFLDTIDLKKYSPHRVMSNFTGQNILEALNLDAKDLNQDEYLYVQKLSPGDHFGLADLLFDKQPSLALVSNGCECILITKEFFVQNSNLEYLKKLKKQEAPYPKIEEFEYNYKIHLDWKRFSNNIVENTLKNCK